MSLNVIYVSANGTKNALGTENSPMDLATAVYAGGENSIIVLLNSAGAIQTSGVALFKNQYILGEGASAVVYHADGVTTENYTAPGSGGALLNGISKYNAVVGTNMHTEGPAVVGVTASGGVNNAGIIAETRYNFVLSGQSNMAGWENVADFDPELRSVQEQVKIWTGKQFESLTPNKNTNPLEFGAAPAKSWAGSELSLGVNLTQALGSEVYLTKVTSGGTSIVRWLNGDMLTHIFTNTLKSSQAIADQGYAPFIGGVGWTQGEHDYGRHSDYDQKLLTLLARMQTEFAMEDLKLIASGTSPYLGGPQIEAELQQAANASDRIEFFSMQHFQKSSNGLVHFDAEGYSYMGYQFAVNLLKDLMGSPVSQEDITGYIPMWLRPVAPEANDDRVTVIAGLTDDTGNVLLNDSDYNPQAIHVSAVGNRMDAVGEWINLEQGGRIQISANGKYIFEHQGAYADLAFGESVRIAIDYQISDEAALTNHAQLQLVIYGQGPADQHTTIYGNQNNNVLTGSDQNDIIYGYEGNDVIYGNNGSEIIFAGAGHDIIYAAKNGNTEDAEARHIIYAGEGSDTVYGAKGDDFIDLGEGNNTVRSYGGNDEIIAGDGNDNIFAASNNLQLDKGFTKQINSGAGNDYIETSDSDDTIVGGDGNKRIYTYGGTDSIKVGNGDNTIRAYATDRNDDINVTKTIISGNGRDIIDTSYGNDKIMVGNGNKIIRTYGGNDTITTGNGNNYIDTARNRNEGSGNTVKVITGSGNDVIHTGASNDLIDSGDGSNTIFSYGGDDYIKTGSGNDNIHANASNRNDDIGHSKTVISDGGRDVIHTSYSNDTVILGDGQKTVFTYGGNDSITTGNGNNYIDTAVSRLAGSGNETTIQTGDGNNVIHTSRTDDYIVTGNGNDIIHAYGGNNIIESGGGNDMIFAFDLDRNNDKDKENYIDAGAGNDTVHGTQGEDTIIGGYGDDTLYGYTGNDLFIFSDSAGKDIIADFNVKDDKILFSNSALSFDDLHFKAVNNDTIVSYFDSQITLRGVAIVNIEENLFIF
ncbi:sialate O-acetylesterase [Serratia sp. DD3]|uniref:sialate O-acetylesterase n=1 Tax=Serratia sp. DD3 TaxID=1410619 RepID=UPI0004D64416|nr:sialate O-acetylesterase [Serratia sp. DD3]KEY60916.1 RTX-I toxin determinant A from serotypes 1/9 [Serratia sp. DD3]